MSLVVAIKPKSAFGEGDNHPFVHRRHLGVDGADVGVGGVLGKSKGMLSAALIIGQRIFHNLPGPLTRTYHPDMTQRTIAAPRRSSRIRVVNS